MIVWAQGVTVLLLAVAMAAGLTILPSLLPERATRDAHDPPREADPHR